MSNNFTQHHRYRSFGSAIRSSLLLHQIRRHWMKPVFIIAVGAVISQKDLSIDMQFNARQGIQESNISFIPRLFSSNEQNSSNNETIKAVNTSLLSGREAPQKIKEPPRTVTTEVQQIPRSQNISQVSSTYKPSSKGDDNLANTYSNLGFDEKKGTSPAKAAKRKKQLAYVKRYHNVAQKEMEKYGIPASIKLAQGLLESNVGESRLAVHNNNHFGIKCFSRTCGKGHCSNFTDDSHKDFFRKYKNAWESYRSHSILLQSKRYKPLKQLKSTDYKGWAYGLKKAGYATDKNYAPKIIGLIEDLQLHKYDQ
jgi:flagellum-specific peptidoglycan hydrolase FlgJ